jgi:hypothetical protein
MSPGRLAVIGVLKLDQMLTALRGRLRGGNRPVR